jgi:hypothetical protein
MERLARDKHIPETVNYARNKFYDTGPTFFGKKEGFKT